MAANPVIIDFILRGMPDVQRAMKTVEQATAAAERASTRAAQRGASDRIKLAQNEAKQREAATRRAQQADQKAMVAIAREREKSLRAELKANDARARAAEQGAQREVRAAERKAQAIARTEEQKFRDLQRWAARADAEDNRRAAAWVRREERRRSLQERDEAANRRRFAGSIGGAAARGVGAGVSRVAGLAGQTAGMVGQLGGGFGIADSVQRTVALKGKLADIASRDVAAEGGKGPRRSTSELEGKVRGVAGEYGIEADKGADALDKFASKTGKLQVGLDMLGGLAELSRAGVGSLDDLADAAGDVFNADQKQTGAEVLDMLRQFALQGAKGSVEMKDMASKLGKVTAAAGRFKGGVANEMLTFGALAQGAKESGGAASPAEAMTSVSSLANQFSKNARLEKMKALGVDTKTEDGFNRPIEDVLMDLLRGAEKKSRAGGRGLHDFDRNFGTAIADAQAQKATNPLTKAFKEAGGGEAGIAAAKAQLAKFGAGGRNLKKEFAANAQARMGEDDVKLAKIRENFDKAVSGRILPALMQLVPEFERLVPMLIDLNAQALPAFVDLLKTVGAFASEHKSQIAYLAAHPIGAIMAAEVTKSIGGALIGEGVKAILQKSFGDAALGGIISKAMSTSLGQAGLIVGTAAIAVTAGMIAIDNEYKDEDKLRDKTRNDAAEAATLAGRLRTGTATDEDRAKARGMVSTLAGDINATDAANKNPGFFKKVGGAVGDMIDPEAAKTEKAAQDQAMAGLVKTLKALETAVRDNTGATRAADGKGGGATGSPGRSKPIVERN